MKKHYMNSRTFNLPNFNNLRYNSNNITIISCQNEKSQSYRNEINDKKLIEILKNNECLFSNSAFVHFCIEKSQIVEEAFNIKLSHLKNDIKTIINILQFYKELFNYYKDNKEILYKSNNFLILEKICKLEEEGKTKEEIKKIVSYTKTSSKKEYFNKYIELYKDYIEAYKYNYLPVKHH
ncbi:hypothetical protein [Brachyspira pulli]|uniref:hypothetical protein n=1 Tax=Brachyspira pulli TaxID=310721 RepID=UPI0030049736